MESESVVPPVFPDPNDIAAIIYTSGTTGPYNNFSRCMFANIFAYDRLLHQNTTKMNIWLVYVCIYR